MFKVDQVPWKERISYGLADTASNLIFTMVATYLLYFYTDVFGIGAAVVGTLFLIVRFIDAITDIITGAIIDKTSTRWGKCRPYFLWLAIPFAIMGVLTFMTPDIGTGAKIVYAYTSYIILGLVYTFINLPISAMLPSMSNNPQERHEVTSIRMIGGQAGAFIVSVATLPLVAFLGGGNDALGFPLTMALYGVIGAILFINAFINTREREYYNSKDTVPFKEGVKALKGNSPWLILFIIKVSFFFVFIMRNQATIFFAEYSFGRVDLVPVLMGLNFLSIASLLFLPAVTKRIGGKKTMQLGAVMIVLGSLVIYASTINYTVILLFAGVGICGLGMGLIPSLLFSMLADTVDYGEYKSGVRANGLLYSGSTFAAKFGMGIGGAAGAWLLALGNYDPALSVQSSTAVFAIDFSYIWFPMISFAIVYFVINFYKLDEIHDKIVDALKAKGTENKISANE